MYHLHTSSVTRCAWLFYSGTYFYRTAQTTAICKGFQQSAKNSTVARVRRNCVTFVLGVNAHILTYVSLSPTLRSPSPLGCSTTSPAKASLAVKDFVSGQLTLNAADDRRRYHTSRKCTAPRLPHNQCCYSTRVHNRWVGGSSRPCPRHRQH